MRKKTKIFIFGLLLFFGPLLGYALAPQITLRLNNPRILYLSAVNYLQFEIEIKCDQSNIFLDGSTIYLSFNTSAFLEASSLVTFGSHYNELNYNGDAKYTKLSSFSTNAGTRRFSIAITSPNAAGLQGGVDTLSEIYTTFHTLLTVRLRISDPLQTAKIFLRQSEMNGVGAYKLLASSTPQSFFNPHLYDSKDFSKLYIGRIYNSVTSWTQYGGTLNWLTSCNTSVWDTGAVVAPSIIGSTNHLATKLRIYAGARLRVAPDGWLTCSDSVRIDEPRGLWVTSTAQGTGSFIDNGIIAYNTGGTARVDRYFTQDYWHYWSMPVTASTAQPFTGLFMRWFDEPTYLFNEIIPIGTPLYPMWGYSVHPNGADATAGVIGNLNTGLLTSPTLTSTYIAVYPPATPPIAAGYDGWNFVGNPYPSSTDWESPGWVRTNLDPWMYTWNGTGYETRSVGGAGTKEDKYIRPEQGFFVHVTTETGASGLISVNNTARVHTTGTYVKSGEVNDKLVLTATANGINDVAHVVFNSDATLNFDTEFDAYKLMGITQAPNLYSRLPSDIIAAVNSLPWTGASQVVPMGFTCGVSGVYHITASNLESFNSTTQIYLEDLKANITQNLTSDPVYQFSYVKGEDPGRFLLHFSRSILGVDDQQGDNIQIYAYDNIVYVKHLTPGDIHGTVLIYDITGQKVFSGELSNLRLNKFPLLVTTGVYMVKVQTDRALVTGKVFINQQ